MDDIRIAKLEQFREARHEPYPYAFERSHTVLQLTVDFDALLEQQASVAIAGRLVAKRVMGKVCFAHVQDDTGRMQIYLRRDDMTAGEDGAVAQYSLFKNATDMGDWIGARGFLMVTKTGERTLCVREWMLLSKCIRPLPLGKEEQETGRRHDVLSDPDQRYRNRALDLVVNPQQRQVFRTRARIVSMIRHHLDREEFLETETPVLQPLYGGGTAALLSFGLHGGCVTICETGRPGEINAFEPSSRAGLTDAPLFGQLWQDKKTDRIDRSGAEEADAAVDIEEGALEIFAGETSGPGAVVFVGAGADVVIPVAVDGIDLEQVAASEGDDGPGQPAVTVGEPERGRGAEAFELGEIIFFEEVRFQDEVGVRVEAEDRQLVGYHVDRIDAQFDEAILVMKLVLGC